MASSWTLEAKAQQPSSAFNATNVVARKPRTRAQCWVEEISRNSSSIELWCDLGKSIPLGKRIPLRKTEDVPLVGKWNRHLFTSQNVAKRSKSSSNLEQLGKQSTMTHGKRVSAVDCFATALEIEPQVVPPW